MPCTLRSIAESSWVPVALVLGIILGYIIPSDSGSTKLRAPWDRISAVVGWTYCELSYSTLSIHSVPTHRTLHDPTRHRAQYDAYGPTRCCSLGLRYARSLATSVYIASSLHSFVGLLYPPSLSPLRALSKPSSLPLYAPLYAPLHVPLHIAQSSPGLSPSTPRSSSTGSAAASSACPSTTSSSTLSGSGATSPSTRPCFGAPKYVVCCAVLCCVVLHVYAYMSSCHVGHVLEPRLLRHDTECSVVVHV